MQHLTDSADQAYLMRVTRRVVKQAQPVRVDGRTLLYWLTETLREERERAGISSEWVAGLLGMNGRKIDRLEGAGDGSGRTYKNIDGVVGAYAYALGLDDPRELFRRALDRWMREGAPQFTAEELPGREQVEFVRPIKEEARRQRQSRAARKETPSSNPQPRRLREAQ